MAKAQASIAHYSDLSSMFVVWLSLLAFGVVMVASAAVVMQGDYLTRHLVYLALALISFGIAFALPTSLWRVGYLLILALVFVFCVLVLVPGIGREVNGASRWIGFGAFTVQAAEVAKFGVCIYLATYLSKYQTLVVQTPTYLAMPLLLIGGVCGLLVAEPDLGSAVVILATSVAVLFVAGAKLRYFLLLVLLGIRLMYVLVLIAPYRMERLVAFLDPWSVAYGSGYQLTQALIAFGRGELFGIGLGESIQKLYYLPEAHNDFILAVVAEELGAFGVLMVAGMLTYIVIQLLRLARKNLELKNLFAAYVAYFVALLIGIQFLVNLGVNTGALPTKGLTLPFVSYGGNSLIVCCALMGVVFRAAVSAEEPEVSARG